MLNVECKGPCTLRTFYLFFFFIFVILSKYYRCENAENQTWSTFFLWWTKVSETVCKNDWHNVKSCLFFSVPKFRTFDLKSVIMLDNFFFFNYVFFLWNINSMWKQMLQFWTKLFLFLSICVLLLLLLNVFIYMLLAGFVNIWTEVNCKMFICWFSILEIVWGIKNILQNCLFFFLNNKKKILTWNQ